MLLFPFKINQDKAECNQAEHTEQNTCSHILQLYGMKNVYVMAHTVKPVFATT